MTTNTIRKLRTTHNEKLKVCSKIFKISQVCHCVTIAPSGGCYQTVECGGGVVRRCWRGVAGDGDRGPGGSLVRTQPLVPPHCLRISGVLPCSLALLPGELRHQPTSLPYCHITTYPHILLTPQCSKYSFLL